MTNVKLINLFIVPLLMIGGVVHAQSSVNLYGLISAGAGYITNEAGGSRFHAISGTNQNPRWGVRGTEDLGGGTSAQFNLEEGFNAMTGLVAQSGRAFGRQASVGFGSKRWGTLSAGRQYDAVKDYLGPVLIASNGVNIGDNDNSYNNIRIQNSVKYVSPAIHGFDFTTVYGLSEDGNGQPRNNNAFSIGAGYRSDALSLGLVHARMDRPNAVNNGNGAVANDYASPLLLFNVGGLDGKTGVLKQTITGAGGLYTVGPAVVGAFFSDVQYRYLDNSQLRLRNFDVNVNWTVQPNVILGASYTQTRGHYDVIGTRPRWHQVNLQADYVLSKRSDLFANFSFQHAAGSATHANIFGFGAATGTNQALTTVGMRHRF